MAASRDRRASIIDDEAEDVDEVTLDASGETGLLVPLEDAPALATSIRTLIDNPSLAARLAESGRNAYEENFTEAAIVRCYLDFFEQVRA